ncbi:hypothetical protein M3Y98_00081000 [Aphelenchoides besseyi]|nr:hypothetical protein M3Y98_00081000 [Aphelenchoides besseyi]KAI6198651.1 hypothetical protein M3Y96_00541900 [Aphelenchoides besseyi]
MRFIFVCLLASILVLLVNAESNDAFSRGHGSIPEDALAVGQNNASKVADNTKNNKEDQQTGNEEQEPTEDKKPEGLTKGKDGSQGGEAGDKKTGGQKSDDNKTDKKKEDGKDEDGNKEDEGEGKGNVCEDRQKTCKKNQCKNGKLQALMKRNCARTCGFCPGGKTGATKDGGKGKGRGRGRAGKGRGRGKRAGRGGKKQQKKSKRSGRGKRQQKKRAGGRKAKKLQAV